MYIDLFWKLHCYLSIWIFLLIFLKSLQCRTSLNIQNGGALDNTFDILNYNLFPWFFILNHNLLPWFLILNHNLLPYYFLINFASKIPGSWSSFISAINNLKYSRLPLSRIPRGSLKHFEISVLRHIRVERVRKTINWTTTFNKWICNLTPEVRNIYIK